MNASQPFLFNTRLHLIYLLPERAVDVRQLRDGIARVPAASIHHHTHRYLHQQQWLHPEPPNDFAFWLSSVLNQRELGEAIASVNAASSPSLDELRRRFLEQLDEYLASGADRARAPEGQEFQFMACRVFVLPTRYQARDLGEFAAVMKEISVGSLYYHFFDARMRLGHNENDFSAWFRSLGKDTLAGEIARLDPYTMTLEGLRRQILRLVEKHG